MYPMTECVLYCFMKLLVLYAVKIYYVYPCITYWKTNIAIPRSK